MHFIANGNAFQRPTRPVQGSVILSAQTVTGQLMLSKLVCRKLFPTVAKKRLGENVYVNDGQMAKEV